MTVPVEIEGLPRTLRVSEVFGPTLQGEGPAAGRRAWFIRLGLCNLDCSWCDTPYTWDWTGKNGPPQDRSALANQSPASLAEQVVERSDPGDIIVISGGEPLVQKRALSELVQMVAPHRDVHIETNGTILATIGLWEHVTQWVISPKLTSSGVDEDRAIVVATLRSFAETPLAAFKFVIADGADLLHARRVIERARIEPSRVWLMPEGRTAAELLPRHEFIAAACIVAGYNMSTRLHVLAWGDRRGV